MNEEKLNKTWLLLLDLAGDETLSESDKSKILAAMEVIDNILERISWEQQTVK